MPAVAAQLNETEWERAIKDVRLNQETEAFKAGWNAAIVKAVELIQ